MRVCPCHPFDSGSERLRGNRRRREFHLKQLDFRVLLEDGEGPFTERGHVAVRGGVALLLKELQRQHEEVGQGEIGDVAAGVVGD
jgi:hypothetical protein